MARRTLPTKAAALEASLRVAVTEGARDAVTGRAAFRMVMIEARGAAAVDAALDLARAALTGPRR